MKKPVPYMQDEHLSRKTREFLKALNTLGVAVETLSAADARNMFEQAQAGVEVDVSGIDESQKTITADGHTLKLDIVRPAGAKGKLPAFIFIHGGGWLIGDYPTHKRLVRDLVVASGCAAVFVNYSLSPEVKFPVAAEEVYAATKWVAENGDRIDVDGSRLAVAGNSAGGNMAAVTALKALENNGPKIKALLMLWPVTDASTDYESFGLFGQDRFLTTPLMAHMSKNYVNSPADGESVYLSLMRASEKQLGGFPPTLIEVAENDILRDQGEAFGRKLDQAGVDVTTVRFNGVIHDWGMLNGCADLPETRNLILFSAAFLKEHLG